MLKLWAFIKLTRPLFLAGGMILNLLGCAIAWREGYPINLSHVLLGQALITFTQLMTQYANEYYDQEADRLNPNRTWFSGGSGVLAQGLISPRLTLRAAFVSGGIALFFLILCAARVPVMIIPGVLALLAGWFYSAPPLKLVASGFGEIAASLVVTGLVPVAGYLIQAYGRISTTVLAISLSLGLIHMAMLIAFHLPDQFTDAQVGKRTLVVRAGTRRAVFIYQLALALGFVIAFILWIFGLREARFLLLAVPLAVWQAARIPNYARATPARFLPLTFGAIALFALSSGLWLAGFTF